MKRLFFKAYLLPAILFFSIVGCDDLLETSPKLQIETDLVLGSMSGIQAVLNASYHDLQPREYYGRDFIAAPEVLADNMRLTIVNSGRLTGQYNNTPGSHIDLWILGYRIINKVNNVIHALDHVSEGSTAEKNKVKGEALFLRALCYFDLVRVYSYNPNHIVEGRDLGVPLQLRPTKSLDDVSYVSRDKVVAVYEQIERDLLVSIDLLNNNNNSTNTEYSPNYASQASAQALLSRLYLYWGKWERAVDFCTRVIDAKIATLATTEGYAEMFAKANNPESVFELNYETTESLGSDALTWLYSINSTGGGYGDVVLTDSMLAQYEEKDVRKKLLKAHKKIDEPVYYNLKFPAGKGTQLDNIEIIRLSEMYLNRAEAYAELGMEVEAQSDLNVIRTRAGLDAVYPTGDILLATILQERRIELAFEGHRWFDLTRRGSDIPKKTLVPFSDYRILAPIPVTETDVNKSLQQNFGY